MYPISGRSEFRFSLYANSASPLSSQASQNKTTVKYLDGAVFPIEVGELLPNGPVTINFSDGRKYEGFLELGRMQDHGKMTWPDGKVYEGWFEKDRIIGEGKIDFPNRDHYVGRVLDAQPDGQGIYTCADGTEYDGEFRNDKLNGKRTIIWANGNTYTGAFLNGKPHGGGQEFIKKTGETYTGQFEEGKRCGKGTITINGKGWRVVYQKGLIVVRKSMRINDFAVTGGFIYENGDIYTGLMVQGKKQGLGQYISDSTGTIYDGDFVDDIAIGIGKLTFTGSGAGHSYVGGVKDGKRHGLGKYTLPDGTTQEGNWVDGILHGKGKITYANGVMYEGDLLHDQFSGEGKLTCINGDVYIGSFIEGRCEGRGTMIFGKGATEGHIYCGDFVNNKRTGQGKYSWLNGDVYEGQFLNARFHGDGAFKSHDGSKLQGTFVEGKCIFGAITYADGTTYHGYIKDGCPDENGSMNAQTAAAVGKSLANQKAKPAQQQRASQQLTSQQINPQKKDLPKGRKQQPNGK